VEELVKSIGVPAIVVLLLLQQIQRMLEQRRKNGGESGFETRLSLHQQQEEAGLWRIESQLDQAERLHDELRRVLIELHSWHALETDEGVKRWYTPSHLGERVLGIDLLLERMQERFKKHEAKLDALLKRSE